MANEEISKQNEGPDLEKRIVLKDGRSYYFGHLTRAQQKAALELHRDSQAGEKDASYCLDGRLDSNEYPDDYDVGEVDFAAAGKKFANRLGCWVNYKDYMDILHHFISGAPDQEGRINFGSAKGKLTYSAIPWVKQGYVHFEYHA